LIKINRDRIYWILKLKRGYLQYNTKANQFNFMKGLSVSRPVFIILIAGSLLLSACRSTDPLRHPKTSATLWVQNSAEYQALSLSVYNTAAGYLERALKDSYWTAHLPQKNKNIPSLLPAIILDVDETVLDNSAYQARMIKKNSSNEQALLSRTMREVFAKEAHGEDET